jgi:hypothetical protein
MKPRWILPVLAAVTAIACAGCCTTGSAAAATPAAAAASQGEQPTDAELQKLESGKWNPSTLGSREAYMALFADDFVSVEYGSDVQGGAHRKTRAEVFSAPPLPPAQFELSEWYFVRADPHVVIVSYRVKGVSFPWHAYATSVWTRRGDKWQTVFYQASTAE